ncbi:MAG: hypothetical protein ACRCW8_05040, partial [Cetobacterium sp.]
ELKEDSNLNQVSLKLWSVSMLPESCENTLRGIFGKRYNDFTREEVLILATAYLEGTVNNSRIQLMIEKHSYDISKILHNLVNEEILIVDGYGKGKIYSLNEDYKETIKDLKNLDLSEDEDKIIQYIAINGSISNEESREKLGFKKDKNVRMFKSLMKKERIIKTGVGSSTRYILKKDN